MTIVNPYALLIRGNEPHHENAMFLLFGLLVGPLSIDRKKVRIVNGGHGANHVYSQTESFFKDVRSEGIERQVIVLYAGHGGKGYFDPANNGDILPYDEWGRLINHGGDFVLINESCHSGSVIKPLRKIGLLPHQGMVLASCRSGETSYGYLFLRLLVDHYINGHSSPLGRISGCRKTKNGKKPFVQHPMRSGKSLDYLLTP